MNVKHLEIDDNENIFGQILESIEKDYNHKFIRIARTAKQGDSFYFTVITENYLILEVTLKILKNMPSIYGLPSFECEVEVF